MLLKGNNAQQIKKILNISNATVHRAISFLTTKSKEYMYDMAKGLPVLAYQRAIEGIGLTLTEAWAKFNDPTVQRNKKSLTLD